MVIKFLQLGFVSMVGKKVIMAASGLAMYLFLIGHLAGNFLLYKGAEAFNAYADFLASLKLIYVAELGLVLVLVLHIWSAINLTRENRKARTVKYHYKRQAKKATWMSSHMFHTGMIIMIFLIVHIVSFKFGPWDNEQVLYADTLFDHVTKSFAMPAYSAFYLISMIALGFHLHHAFKSALLTLGITRKQTLDLLATVSSWLSIALALGFASFPVYFYLISLL